MLAAAVTAGVASGFVAAPVSSRYPGIRSCCRPCLTTAPLGDNDIGSTTTDLVPYNSDNDADTAENDESDRQQPFSTPVSRMRRRKASILHKKKAYKTTWLLFLWYGLSVGFNVFTKKGLNTAASASAPNLAYTTAFLQMAGGLTYLLPLWMFKVRTVPRLSTRDVRRILPVAVLHSLVHIGGVVAMSAGSVSFTAVVKASEPAVSAALGALLTGTFLYWTVYVALLPVIAGVSLASVSELDFTWKSFNYAMLSNVASSGRAIIGKKRIDQRLGQNVTPLNLYAILTVMSTVLLLPVALLVEGPTLLSNLRQLASHKRLGTWLFQTYLASLFYCTYNETAFAALNNVSPVSHAVANVLKRVFIIVSSMVVFRTRMTPQGAFGSAMAIGGVLWYSLEKQRHSPKAKKQ